MIIYSKTLWGLPLLSRIYGSALPRALAPALVAGFITLGMTFVSNEVSSLWLHPYAYNAFVLLVSFVLTFRSNYAYQRHWEAYSNMQTMASKWVDAAMQIVMFDRHPQHHSSSTRHPGMTAAELVAHKTFLAELVHLISLLHAVSCQALRRDPDLHNLTRHSKHMEAPPSDPALLRSTGSGPVAGGDAAAAVAGSSGSTPAAAAAAPAAAAAAATPAHQSMEGAGEDGVDGLGGGSFSGWGIISAWGRGTNIVGSANWRDVFMLRGSSEIIRKYNAAQPLPVIGGTSLDELSALGCSRHFYSSDWQELSPRQRQQQQQTLPRARSLSQLFAATSSNSTVGQQGQRGATGAFHSYRRSNSNLLDVASDDTWAAEDTASTTAPAAAAAIGSMSFQQQPQQRGLVTYEAWGGPVSGRYPGQAPSPANQASLSRSTQRELANNTTGSRSSSAVGCWPWQKDRQQQQEHVQADLHQQADQQQQQGGGGGAASGARAYRRFLSADGTTTSQLPRHVSITTSALNPTSQSCSFPGFMSGRSFNGGSGSSFSKQPEGLKRAPSARFVLISRNCSCCKGHLPYMDRPLLVMAWLHELLLERQSEGGLRMPAPILSRVYTCLSEGLQGFEQCRKLADTPFPFPWAQFVLVMLVLFTLTLPLLVLAYVPNSPLAVVLTVVTVATYWTVNEVARDVEDPFLYEPNDMPLANSQYHINELLLSLAHAHRPSSSISSLRRASATSAGLHTPPPPPSRPSKPQQQPVQQPVQQQRRQPVQQQQQEELWGSQAQPSSTASPFQSEATTAAAAAAAAASVAAAGGGDRGSGLEGPAGLNPSEQRYPGSGHALTQQTVTEQGGGESAFLAAPAAAAAAAGSSQGLEQDSSSDGVSDGTELSSSSNSSSIHNSSIEDQQQQQQQQPPGFAQRAYAARYPAAVDAADTAVGQQQAASAAAETNGSMPIVSDRDFTGSNPAGDTDCGDFGPEEASLRAWQQQQQQQQQQQGAAAAPAGAAVAR